MSVDLELAYHRADLDNDIDAKEAAQRALVKALEAAAVDPPAPVELKREVSLARYIEAASHDRALDGAEGELNAELGLPDSMPDGGRAIPLGLLDDDAETRADANTAITATQFEGNIRPAVMTAFAGTDLTHLRVPVRRVPVGTTRVPIISAAGAAATPVAKSTAVDAVKATISTVELSVKQIRSAYRYSASELYEWSALDRNLRTLLREKLASRLDDMALTGSGTAPQPTGIFGSLAAPSNPSGIVKGDTITPSISALVDGIYTNTESGMRILLGIKTYAFFRGLSQRNLDGIELIERLGVGVRASTRVPAVASKRQDALVSLSARAASDAYMVAVWNAFSLIRDPYTHSNEGDVALRAALYYDCAELLDGGIKRIRYQVAA